MPSCLNIIVFILALSFSLDAYAVENGYGPFLAAHLAVTELCTPRLAFSKFHSLLVDKETAQNTIESVDFVDTNYIGKFLSVKLRKDSNFYRVCSSEIGRAVDPYSLDEVKRLGGFGISVGFYFQCL